MVLEVEQSKILTIGKVLNDSARPLKERFRALFTLRNIGGEVAINSIANAFTDPSALLKHELAYCLGQMGDLKAIPILTKILEDENEEPIVRHEAGEALGAIGDASVLPLLERFSKHSIVEVAETCELALGRIKWMKEKKSSESSSKENPFLSIDPTPPSDEKNLQKLRDIYLNESDSLFNRYRAMFSLRNLNTPESAKILAEGFNAKSALFRHEVGFVLGQMANDSVVKELSEIVQNKTESAMVRHEAAEALGSIATPSAMAVLEAYLKDDARVVRESCEVALDMCEYENSSEFQYADALAKLNS